MTSKNYEKDLVDFLANNFTNGIIKMKKDAPEAKYLEKAQNVILSDLTGEEYHSFYKPYFTTTQNQRYLTQAVPAKAKSACVILGAGDTTFQLLSQGIKDITALENNDLQILTYYLRLAAIKGLSNSEFEDFLLDCNGINFLSLENFNKVKEYFDSDKIVERDFWEKFLQLNPIEDIKSSYIKGGLEQNDLFFVRYALPYLSKKGKYYALRDKIAQAKLQIQLTDAIEYLMSSEDKFDYIDITNILLTMFQNEYDCNPEKFNECVEKLKLIYEKKLNSVGTFVMDYVFGMSKKEMERVIDISALVNKEFLRELDPLERLKKKQEFVKAINATIFNKLNQEFSIDTFEVQSSKISVTSLDGACDTVVLARKR